MLAGHRHPYWQYRSQHAYPNLVVNVIWSCTLPSLVVFLSAVEANNAHGMLDTIGLIWLIGALVLIRGRRMGVAVTPDGLRLSSLLRTRTVPGGGEVGVRVDRVVKEQLVYLRGSRTIALPHLVHIGRQRARALGLYPEPNVLQRRRVHGWRAGPWETSNVAWGDPRFAATFSANVAPPRPGAAPEPPRSMRELLPTLIASNASVAALIAYAITGAAALVVLSLVLMVLAGSMLRRVAS